MNIYRLDLIHTPRSHLDYHDGFVVVALSSAKARRLAADHETPKANPEFLDRLQTTCLKLGVVTGKLEPQVILASFNAG